MDFGDEVMISISYNSFTLIIFFFSTFNENFQIFLENWSKIWVQYGEKKVVCFGG